MSLGNVLRGELVERTSILDVGESGLQLLELNVNLLLGLLGLGNLKHARRTVRQMAANDKHNTYSLSLEGLDRLEGGADVVGGGLEVVQELLSLIDNGLVLQYRAVASEVNGGGLASEVVVNTLGIGVTLAEGLDGSDGLYKSRVMTQLSVLNGVTEPLPRPREL